MFRVMIVEDEPPIMRMVRSAVESADPDFVVMSCCFNGGEAVEALKKDDYDIVFTDIKMPVMTGIELAGWIYENKPETMVIILSGFSDFEYAKKALAYKVFDYLLKPVSKEKIRELGERIRREMGKKTETAAHDDDRDTVVILACAGAYLLYGSEAMLPGENFWADERIENFVSGLLEDGEEYISFNSNTPSERYLVIESDSPERQEALVDSVYGEFCDAELPVTVVYKSGVRFRDAGKTFSGLRDRLIKSLILGRSQKIRVDSESEGYDNIAPPYSKQDIEAMTAAIKNGNMDELRKRFSDVMQEMGRSGFTQEDVNGFLNVVLDTYALNYPKYMQRKNTSVKREFVNALAAFTSFDAFLDDVVSILMTLRRDVNDPDRYSQLADSVEEFLINNYDRDVTSKVLAREFGFVPSYISRIFKRNKGLSPNEFITKYRVGMARRIIEENPDMKIKEVANTVGFKEAYYFSKTFKRETGMWPTEVNKKEE